MRSFKDKIIIRQASTTLRGWQIIFAENPGTAAAYVQRRLSSAFDLNCTLTSQAMRQALII